MADYFSSSSSSSGEPQQETCPTGNPNFTQDQSQQQQQQQQQQHLSSSPSSLGMLDSIGSQLRHRMSSSNSQTIPSSLLNTVSNIATGASTSTNAQARSNSSKYLNSKRRMSSWAVFEAVMGQESFVRSMSDDRPQPHNHQSPPTSHHRSRTDYQQPNSLSAAAAKLRQSSPTDSRPPLSSATSSSRLFSPDRMVFHEPDPVRKIINSTASDDHRQNFTDDPGHQPTAADQIDSNNQCLGRNKFSFLRSILSTLIGLLPDSFIKQFRVILKCSIAYFIASLFSFYDPLSDLLVLPFGLEGPFSGAHVIATIVTYYRPASTVGGMMEANHYAFWGVVWLVFLIVGSTLTSVIIENRTISHAIVLIVFVGFGYGTAAWVKQKSPGFSSTCSMIILISAVIITREGSIHYGYLDFKKTLIYTEIVMIGMLISNLTCIAFWRGSATQKLKNDVNSTLDSFSTLIGMLTMTFLLDETIYTDQDRLKKAIDKHHASFTSLKQSLDAASYEFFEPKIQRSQSSYQELVDSMNRLAQHLAGLRSGCGLQHDIMEAARAKCGGEINLETSSIRSGLSTSADLEPTKQVFVAFCESIGPSLKTLMATGMACLHDIKTSNENGPSGRVGDEGGFGSVERIIQMRYQLLIALQAFEDSHSAAMRKLYADYSKRSNTIFELGTSSDFLSNYQISQPNEGIFVICFFIFNMEEFMKELCHLLDVFAEIRADEEALAYESETRRRKYLNKFLYCFNKKQPTSSTGFRPKPRPRRQRPKLTAVLPRDPRRKQPIPVSQSVKEGEQNSSLLSTYPARFKRNIYDFFQSLNDPDTKVAIKVGAGAAVMTFPAFWDATRPIFHKYRGQWAVVTYMIVTASTLGQTNFLVITRFLGTLAGSLVAIVAYHLFWEDPVALPLIGFLFSIPCYWLIVCFPRLALTGRFLLLTYNLVCVYSYNVRDDNVHILVTAYRRVMCVVFGVSFGWVVNNFIWPYKARRELRKCLSEFLLECAFLYTYLVKRYSSSGDEVEEGQVNEETETVGAATAEDEGEPLLTKNIEGDDERVKVKAEITEFSNMELFLQVKLNRLFNLLAATQHEPRLKGPFPTERYRRMLNGCQSLLDMIHSLGSVTSRKDWFRSMREEVLIPIQVEHKEMVGNILLYFGLLSTSIELKSPLPPYLPPANQARQRLFNKIKLLTSSSIRETSSVRIGRSTGTDKKEENFNNSNNSKNNNSNNRNNRNNSNSNNNNDNDNNRSSNNGIKNNNSNDKKDDDEREKKNDYFLLLFAFLVALRKIIGELELIGIESQSLFGIIGGSENLNEFEQIFM